MFTDTQSMCFNFPWGKKDCLKFSQTKKPQTFLSTYICTFYLLAFTISPRKGYWGSHQTKPAFVPGPYGLQLAESSQPCPAPHTSWRVGRKVLAVPNLPNVLGCTKGAMHGRQQCGWRPWSHFPRGDLPETLFRVGSSLHGISFVRVYTHKFCKITSTCIVLTWIKTSDRAGLRRMRTNTAISILKKGN